MTVRVLGMNITTSKFPGGELHLDLNDSGNAELGVKWISCDFNSNDDLMYIAMAVDALRGLDSEVKIFLEIPYFPYARQDRRTSPGTAFSLKIVTDFINSLKLDFIRIDDPHSAVLPSLLNNCGMTSGLAKRTVNLIFETITLENDIVIVSPDAGAVKRAEAVSMLIPGSSIAIGHKHREPSTGKILSTTVFGDIKDGDTIVMVDDCIDGGRTFTELAKVLHEKNKDLKIYLFATFGIFSKGMGVFSDFKGVYCLYNFWDYAK